MDTLKERIAVIVDSECGGNKSDFARRVGIAPAYAAQIYAGVRSPSPRLIADICREFSINPDWLACGAEPMRQQVSREEELAAFFGELSRDPDGSVRKRFIAESFFIYYSSPVMRAVSASNRLPVTFASDSASCASSLMIYSTLLASVSSL